MQNNSPYPEITLDKFPEAITLILSRFDAIADEILDLKVAAAKTEEKLLSPTEAAKLFEPKISIKTLYNWSEQGLIEKHYLGGRTFYKRSELIASLKTLKKYKVGNLRSL